jgi:hypothetical protein
MIKKSIGFTVNNDALKSERKHVFDNRSKGKMFAQQLNILPSYPIVEVTSSITRLKSRIGELSAGINIDSIQIAAYKEIKIIKDLIRMRGLLSGSGFTYKKS